MILADNGSNWYVSGAPDPHWSNDELHSLGRITGSCSRWSTPRRSTPDKLEAVPTELRTVDVQRYGTVTASAR